MASYDQIIIAKLLKGEQELIPELRPELFDGRTSKLYSLIIEHYNTHMKLPNATVLSATVEERAPTASVGPFQAIIKRISDLDVADIPNELALKSLTEAYVLRSVDDKIESLVEFQRDKDAKNVKLVLADLMESIAVQNVKIDDFAEAMESDEKLVTVPTGLGPGYDDLMGGGFTGLAVISAKSGGGKTILLLQSAIEAFLAGHSVMFLSLELSAKQLGNRMKAYLTGIPFHMINSGNLTEAERALITKTMDETFKGRDNQFRITTTHLDTVELINVMTVERQLHNVDAFYLDYIGLVSAPASDRGESWATTARLAKDLHKFSLKNEAVVVTGSQVSEVKKSKDGLSVEVVSRGSQEIKFSSSQMLYLEREEGSDAAISYVVKNRLNQERHCMMETDFATMKFKDTGIILN